MKWNKCWRRHDIPIKGWNDQTNFDQDFLTWITDDLTATDMEFAYIYEHMVLAEHVLFQQSESTPNTSCTDVNTSDTDTEVKDKNALPDNQAQVPGDNIDPSYMNVQVS
jgi:hypothetical protein